MNDYIVDKKYSRENDDNIIKEVLEKINIKYEHHKYFENGSYSKVILLNDSYIIKQSNSEAIKAEIEFLKITIDPKLQSIVVYDDEYNYVVYKFIKGEVIKSVIDSKKIIKDIKEFTDKYQNYIGEGYGHLYKEKESWTEFLLSEMEYYSLNAREYVKDNNIVKGSIIQLERYSFSKKLIHGDLGAHNFIEDSGEFVGIIDPMPIIGDSLYDLLSAVVSNINIVNNLDLNYLFDIINDENEKVKLMLIVVVYFRISKCLKYHKNDIEKYMEFWHKIIKL